MNRTIYFETDTEFKTLNDLIRTYFIEGQPATYYSDTKELQCRRGCRRSFDDMLMLANHYFPGTDIKTLCKAFKRNAVLNGESFITIIWCPDIEKTVSRIYYHPEPYRYVKNSTVTGTGISSRYKYSLCGDREDVTQPYYNRIRVKGNSKYTMLELYDYMMEED